MASAQLEQAYEKYRYEALFGTWLLVTGATFMRIRRQPYSTRLKVEQYESIFKGTSLGAMVLGIGLASPHFHMQSILASTHRSFLALVASQPSKTLTMLFHLGKVSIELNPWNPLYAVAPFVIVLASIPLAMIAVVTTSIALSLLAFRGFLVYTQLGTALLSAWLSPTRAKFVAQHHQPPSPKRTSPPHNRHRRSSSSSSGISQDTIGPPAHINPKSGSFTSVLGERGITRDYEGVGGWRDTGDEDEEALWMGINSRLQLPAASTDRRHQRRHTGGQSPSQRWSWSPEAFRMSPVQSRARTPNRVIANEIYYDGDYFPTQSANDGRPISTASDPMKRHGRRSSGSGSSITSVASSLMAPVKESAE